VPGAGPRSVCTQGEKMNFMQVRSLLADSPGQ
jgi:hypothetical protein